MGWRDWRYLLARLGGYATPELVSVPALAGAAAATAAFLEDVAQAEPTMADAPGGGGQPELDREPELESSATGTGGVAPPRFIPPAAFQPPHVPGPDGYADGNGHHGGHGGRHHGNGNGNGRLPATDPWGEEL
jgi:hypothetical protein